MSLRHNRHRRATSSSVRSAAYLSSYLARSLASASASSLGFATGGALCLHFFQKWQVCLPLPDLAVRNRQGLRLLQHRRALTVRSRLDWSRARIGRRVWRRDLLLRLPKLRLWQCAFISQPGLYPTTMRVRRYSQSTPPGRPTTRASE